MRLKNVVIVVKDIERAKYFYKTLFGLDTLLEQEGNVILTEGLVLQDAKVWKACAGLEVIAPNHASILYFEETDMDSFVRKLNVYEEPIQYILPLKELEWGQKIIRFYDLDGHLIEVRSPIRCGGEV